MFEALIFVAAIPLSVELAGACVAVFDNFGQLESRAAAVERVAVPLLLWGALWWLGGPGAAPIMLAAMAFVLVWQFIAHAALALLGRWPRFFTTSIETDSQWGALPSEKKSPGDNGDWGGERKSPGR